MVDILIIMMYNHIIIILLINHIHIIIIILPRIQNRSFSVSWSKTTILSKNITTRTLKVKHIILQLYIIKKIIYIHTWIVSWARRIQREIGRFNLWTRPGSIHVSKVVKGTEGKISENLKTKKEIIEMADFWTF